MARVWLLAAAALLSGCPDDDGAMDPVGVAEGEGEASGCEALCERLEAVGLLCGDSQELGRSVGTCVDACGGGPDPGLGDVSSMDCATLAAALPARWVMPCLCAPDPARFEDMANGPLAGCAGCHAEFAGEGGYDAVLSHVADPLRVEGSRLFCKAVGCQEHSGGAIWPSAGSCGWRAMQAWVQGAAIPGDDCEPWDEPVDCVSECGDPPVGEGEGEGEGEGGFDPDDFARFEAEVHPALARDCKGCHSGGMGGLTASDDARATYDSVLPRIDRDDPSGSVFLQRSRGEGHMAIWTEAGCGYVAALAWIAGDARPACLDE